MAALHDPGMHCSDLLIAFTRANATESTPIVVARLSFASMLKSIIAISIGSILGALLRWWLGLKLNAQFPWIPPGTLAANLIGAYIVGIAVAFFATAPNLSPEWRLAIITGFCGGLTTFSTFSVEVVALLQQGRLLWALGAAGVHLVGSIILTFAGIGTVALARG
jgi:CrcB protein